MARCLLQAGHYPDGGGAPGEAAWTYALALAVAARLHTAGVETVIVGNWYGKVPPPAVHQTHDLFVSLHYDAAIYADRGEQNTGCFADRAERDPMAAESDRFIGIWQALYPAATHIPLAVQRRNANTAYYYGFTATTQDTPGVLLEHGCGAPVPSGRFPAGDDAAFLHGQMETVAALDAQAILAYLGVQQPEAEVVDPVDPVAIAPEPELTEAERALLDLHRTIGITRAGVELLISRNGRAAELGRQLVAARLGSGQRRAIGRELAAWAEY